MLVEETVDGELEQGDMVLAKTDASGQPLPKQVRVDVDGDDVLVQPRQTARPIPYSPVRR